MIPDHTILAASDNTIGNVIFAALFFLIWAISQGISILAKRNEEARKKRQQAELNRTARQRPQSAPIPQRPVSSPRPKATVPPRIPQKAKSQKRFPVKLPPPIPARPKNLQLASEPVIIASTAPISSPAAQPARKSNSATANTLNTWMRPATLRQQFILTEIFQPPLALRSSDPRTEL